MQRTMQRTIRTTIGAVALATLLTALSGCGRAEPTRSVSAQAGPTPSAGTPDVAVTEAPYPDDRPAVEPTPEQQAYVDRWEHDEPQGVVDAKGEVRGTIRPSEAEAQSDRVLERLTTPAKGDERPQVKEVSTREREAYQVLEAIEVVDAKGDVTGYWAGTFIAKEDFPAALQEAERLTGEKPAG